MKNSHLPLFGNTCGKLYKDYIVLASANRERTLPLNSVKKIRFSKDITITSLLFMLVPGTLFILPEFFESDDTFIKALLYATGILFFALSIFKAERSYTVKIFTNSGSVLKITLLKENMRDAKKFVLEANKQLDSNVAIRKAAAAEERLAENIFSVVN